MKRRFLYIFLLIFILGFLVWPKTSLAEINPEEIIENQDKIELSKKDAKLIFLSLKQGLKNELIELPSPEEQAVLLILSQAIKVDAMHYLLIEIPKEIGKILINATIKVVRLILSGDTSLIITEIEKLTIQEAKKYLMNWLLQNEIKAGKGNLEVSYPAYNGGWQKATFPYIIVYHPLEPNFGEVGINIYSSKNIYTPAIRANYQWEGGVEELLPFIVKISGKVEKVGVGLGFYYNWVEEPEIEVVFDEPVPDLGFEEPGFFDKLEARLNEIKVVFEKVIDIFFGSQEQVAEQLKATIAPEFSLLEEEEEIVPKIEEIKQELGEIIQKAEPGQGIGGSTLELSLAEIQELLDDISERIEIISQQVAALVGSEGRARTAEGEELEAEEELVLETKPEQVGQKEIGQEIRAGPGRGGTSKTEPSYCQKSSGVQPTKDKIIINEVAWMGTEDSANNEWIELKNITDNPVNLANYQLLDKENQLKIIFSANNIIPVQGFYLLERTDDYSVPGILADFIYTGALKNEDEALYLFDANCQLQDEVEASPDWPAGDNETKKTMERKSDFSWQTSLNPGGTPKRENSLPVEAPPSGPEPGQPFEEQEEETPQDTTSPEVIFELEPIQTTLSFDLSWTGTDPMDSVSPSGIDGFYLQYQTPSIETTSPSGEEGVALWYQDENEEWPGWPVSEILELGADRENLQVLGTDEYIYSFQIQAKDKAGNLSNWQEASTKISLPKVVLINEVQIDGLPGSGGADNDWVELYNPSDFDISLSNWSIQEHSSDDPCSIDKSFYKKNFPEGTVIPAKGFFLIVDTEAGDCLKNIADLTIGWSLTKANTIYLVKNQEKIEDGEDSDIVDKVGFGLACFPEGNSAENPSEGQCLERKELGLDTNDNSQDFEIKESPSPTNSQGQTVSLPCLPSFGQAPWPMFLHDSQATNRSPFSGPGISEEPKLETFIEKEELSSPVIGSDGTIYLPTSQGLFAFYYNGTQKWVYELSSIFGMPGLWEPTKTIYIFSQDEGISAIDIQTGSLRWKKEFNILYPNQGPIIGDDGKIYFITEDSGLIALDEQGEQSWFYDFGPISGPVSNLTIDPVRNSISNGVDREGNVYFGYKNTLFAVNGDGEKWQRTFETKCKYYTCQPRVSNLSLADDETIYVMVADEEDFVGLTDADRLNCLHAINLDNPEPEQEKWPALCWRFSLIPIPISSQGNLYTAVSWINISANLMTRIVGYDSQGNSLVNWQPPSFENIGQVVSIIIDKEETVYAIFSYYDNTVKALTLNGEVKWSLKLERGTGTVFSLILGGDNTLFVPTQKKLFVIK